MPKLDLSSYEEVWDLKARWRKCGWYWDVCGLLDGYCDGGSADELLGCRSWYFAWLLWDEKIGIRVSMGSSLFVRNYCASFLICTCTRDWLDLNIILHNGRFEALRKVIQLWWLVTAVLVSWVHLDSMFLFLFRLDSCIMLELTLSRTLWENRKKKQTTARIL